jgi:hypothetical protein
MRTYFRNIKHITSLMAFIVALLISMSFATVSNAAAVPGNPVISNPVTMNAVVPPMAVTAVNPALGAKSSVIGARPFGFGVRPFGFGVSPFGFGVRPFGFGFNPFGFGVSPFGFGFNPFFDVDVDFVGFEAD